MKKARKPWYKPALIGVVVLGLLVSSSMQRHLNGVRSELGLTRSDVLENAPPLLAFTTVALGSFRGLIANALWMRATDLQDEGKYFEMIQLSSWITKLQPRITTVWYHLAWNMAYNISIKFQSPEDRWKWVMAGVELLRDEGIPWNPRETLLYRELAWFFQHKIGANLDDAHMYFKTFWAKEMDDLFGGGRPDFDSLADPQDEATRARVELLRERYKMDPGLMKAVDEEYGPLEWRLPETHAIYWAYVGLQRSKPEELMTLRRVIYQSMQMAFHRGRLIENDFDRTVEFGPNLDITDKVSRSYLAMMEEEPDMKEHIGRAHRNFLKDAIYFLYTHNRRQEAQYWLNYVREHYPEFAPEQRTLDEYVVAKVTEVAGETSHDKVKMAVEGLLKNAYYNLAIGEDEQFIGLERLATKIHNRFVAKTGERAGERIPLRPMDFYKRTVVDELLSPATGFSPALAAQLRTRLGLSASTNAAPQEVEASGGAEPPQ